MTRCPEGCDGCLRAMRALGWGAATPHRATGFAERLVGLAGGGRTPRSPPLAFPSCSSVHTFTMRRRIDVAFIARDGSVLACREGVAPGRVLSCPGAACALEREHVRGGGAGRGGAGAGTAGPLPLRRAPDVSRAGTAAGRFLKKVSQSRLTALPDLL